MVELLSPLGDAWRPGSHGNFADGVGVVLSETHPGSIVEAAAWPGEEPALIAAIAKATGLALPDTPGGGAVAGGRAGFGIGPRKFLLVDQAEGLAQALSAAIPIGIGAVTDLSHGRIAIRIAGPQAEWVLSKLFAIDFSPTAFPLHAGRATAHHDILAAIQRGGEEQFDLYVFRSFARSFWKTLCRSAEDVGYEVR